MFLKQYSYKPRSGSQSSGSDAAAQQRTNATASADSPPAKASSPTGTGAGTAAGGAVSGAIAGRRRSSDAQRFAGLAGYKRNSQDQGAAARKASFAEQSASSGGILSGMWHNFTKGQ